MEVEIIDNKQQRAQLASRTDVLDRVKRLATVPNHEFATTEQVAAFYEVGAEVPRDLVRLHRSEFESTGYRVIHASELRELKKDLKLSGVLKGKSAQALWDRRAVLLLGMLLRDSEVAKTVRRYLLAAEEKAHEIATAPKGAVVEVRPDEYTNLLDKLMYTVSTSNKTVQAVLEQNNTLIKLLLGNHVGGVKTVRVFGPEYLAKELGEPLVEDGVKLSTWRGRDGRIWAGYRDEKGKVLRWLDYKAVVRAYQGFIAHGEAA
ncbi:hypothetical protein [Segniliparus rugosus]|uniref:Uncharacterized protein n=1 Tax=Segniliparus rugosus (strain ATCC BAA-974 / DSM 45345 / CCUG 50838 / CIP 108380 / JCM 13579 / CDC 945) TaxID=679197 RepID=E5XRV1_SEGRC|nr:hypothetical protein [Segniliparus rugosus]EFV12966.1 hypothetical protein HMPREF9336_02223 [Segniliparus rugosus ATCC BAA-974]